VLAMSRDGGLLRSPGAVRFGLWLYERWTGARGARCAVDSHCLEALLDSGTGLQLFDYEDAQCEFPERLVAEWLGEALQAGAIARNYTEVLEIIVRDAQAQGIRVRDKLSGSESEIRGRWIINATGPWADIMCSRSNIKQRRMVGGVKGSHIVLPRFTSLAETGALTSAVYAEAEDKRPIFVVPWAEQVLVGTTEVAYDGDPAEAAITADETQYLLRAVQRLFPRERITEGGSAVRAAYSGVRPLPYSPGKPASSVTRRSYLHDHLEDGTAHLISVIGGKLTTASSLARECARKIGVNVADRDALVAIGPGDGIASALSQWTRAMARKCDVSEETALAVAQWHGRAARRILKAAASSREMSERLCPHTAHIAAEAHYAFTEECATSLADVLLRRVPLAMGACWSRACAQHASRAVATLMGWSEAQRRLELARFEQERARFLGVAPQPAPELAGAVA